MYLITIDGPAGSGKTTLASLIHDLLASEGENVLTIHMDDLYPGWDGAFTEHVSKSLTSILEQARTLNEIQIPQYDWISGRFMEPLSCPTPSTLIIEGVGSGQKATQGSADLKLWIEAPSDIALARVLERDGEAIREEMVHWQFREVEHFRSENTESAADYRIKSAP